MIFEMPLQYIPGNFAWPESLDLRLLPHLLVKGFDLFRPLLQKNFNINFLVNRANLLNRHIHLISLSHCFRLTAFRLSSLVSRPSFFCFPILVPRAGLEPAQSFDHEILSLARIPISPPRPSHRLEGVARVAPFSSRSHP